MKGLCMRALLINFTDLARGSYKLDPVVMFLRIAEKIWRIIKRLGTRM